MESLFRKKRQIWPNLEYEYVELSWSLMPLTPTKHKHFFNLSGNKLPRWGVGRRRVKIGTEKYLEGCVCLKRGSGGVEVVPKEEARPPHHPVHRSALLFFVITT